MPDVLTELNLKQKAIEREKCKASFTHFLSYCRIIETPTIDNSGGVIPFELWPHLITVIKTYLSAKLISILKARQIGLSYITAAYVLWFALFKKGANILLFSKGESEAFLLLDKCRRIYLQLPDFLRLHLNPDSRGEIGFPVMSSSIRAMPSTESAGIGHTTSIVVCDEHDEHPYAARNFEAAKPTIDRGMAQFISIFTCIDPDPLTVAKVLFKDALAEKNDFVPLFFPWDVVPGRDNDWYEYTKRNTVDAELQGLTPELYMMRSYPKNIEEALTIPQQSAAFDKTTLNQMMENIRNPVKVEGDLDFGVINIFKPFQMGQFYIASSDASHGSGKDFAVTTVMNVKTGEIVADILRQDLPPEELAWHSVKLLKYYKNPKWFPENNDWGRVVITKAQELGYKNFGYMDDKKTEGKEGWRTDSKSRIELFGNLIPAVNNNQIIIYNKDGLKQFYDVIRNVKQGGRIEALAGRHDDYPIAVGICWAKRDEVHLEDWTPKTINTLNYQPTSKPWRR